MDISVTSDMDMLDSAHPCRVYDDFGHDCQPGLSATLPRRRYTTVPKNMALLLSKRAHNHVAEKALQELSGVVPYVRLHKV